jgi:hypothetical protein
VGWVHPNKLLNRRFYNSWLNSSEMLFQGPSFYLQLNRWRIGKKGKPRYFGLILGYRYLSYRDKLFHVYDSDGRSYDRDLNLSQWRNDILVLGTFGIATTRFTMSEISLGVRLMFTHTRVNTIKNGLMTWTEEQNPSFVAATLDMMPYNEGFNMAPIIRITSRIGWFQ